MIESYEELAGRIEILSNYFKKYLNVVQQHTPKLRKRLDERGMTGRVHLWRKAADYHREMTAVMQVAETPAEKRQFLGTYFALQMLHLHFLNIHWLHRESANYQNRLQVYQHILTRLRFQLRDLTTSYLSALIGHFSGQAPTAGLALCNMGMILDQDDLDVGVFVGPDLDREFWNPVISQVAAEFFKYSTNMHFYLAERVTHGSYLTTIEDVRSYLRRGVHNFVLISELLLTESLLGDEELVQRLESTIIDRFYFDYGNFRLHEGYLRGMVGEVESLLRPNLASSTWLSPKNHGLRLIHSMMNMLKTIHGVHLHGSRDTLEMLIVRDPESASIYRNLQNILSFVEMFYYVYQLLVSTEEVFDFTDAATMENLDQVAEVMGYGRLGLVRPAQRLLTHYVERMDWLQRIAESILDKINSHLRQITVFHPLIKGERPADYPVVWSGNIALNILEMFKMYRGMIYWDDILFLLAEDDCAKMQILLDSLEELPETQRNSAFERLMRLLSFDMDSMVATAVLLGRFPRRPLFRKYARHILVWLIETLGKRSDRMAALVNLIHIRPAVLMDFLLQLETDQLLRLRRLARQVDDEPAVDAADQEKFAILCELLAFSSNLYRQFFAHVAQRRPEIVTQVNDISMLNRISDEIWAGLPDAGTPQDLREQLSVYYEFSFCRCGLMAINDPGNVRALYGAYHSFFRRYFRWLYHAAQWQIEIRKEFGMDYRRRDEDDQPLAIFCAGGYAREEAFENDIDLFVLSWDDDPEFNQYALGVVNEINRELTRRGVIPQHRLAEFFDSLVIPVSRLREFLSREREHDFIEISQILGGRLLIGSRSFDAEISSLLDEVLFQRPGRFIHDLMGEIVERQTYHQTRRERKVNVKEDPGALRDIQLVVTACQALVRVREPVIWPAIRQLIAALPSLAGEFRTLERSYRFIRFFKDFHALSLSADDDILRDRLRGTAKRMGLESGELEQEDGSAPRLLKMYRYHRQRSRQAIERIREYLLEHTPVA